jgi:hypothetical protein
LGVVVNGELEAVPGVCSRRLFVGVLEFRGNGTAGAGEVEEGGGRVDEGSGVRGSSRRRMIEGVRVVEGEGGEVGIVETGGTRGGPWDTYSW